MCRRRARSSLSPSTSSLRLHYSILLATLVPAPVLALLRVTVWPKIQSSPKSMDGSDPCPTLALAPEVSLPLDLVPASALILAMTPASSLALVPEPRAITMKHYSPGDPVPVVRCFTDAPAMLQRLAAWRDAPCAASAVQPLWIREVCDIDNIPVRSYSFFARRTEIFCRHQYIADVARSVTRTDGILVYCMLS